MVKMSLIDDVFPLFIVSIKKQAIYPPKDAHLSVHLKEKKFNESFKICDGMILLILLRVGYLFKSEIESILKVPKMVFLQKQGFRGLPRDPPFVRVLMCLGPPGNEFLVKSMHI